MSEQLRSPAPIADEEFDFGDRKLLDYEVLKRAGIVQNRVDLSRKMRRYNFPRGFVLTGERYGKRHWTPRMIIDWINQRRALNLKGKFGSTK
jgi:hypothetical protein